jgi:predicted ATPase/tetratricopeptide (TPR) repeat protein
MESGDTGPSPTQAASGNAGAPPRPAPPLTPTIGRDDDGRRLLDALGRARLVTLVGPGGVGKTRLALDAARHLAGDHSRGAIVVELARVADATGVVSTIAEALELRGVPAAGHTALEGAGALDALLVLDNCEHVIDATANALPHLLAGGERLRVLATSREALRCDGEHLVVLGPLPTDGNDAPAIELLRQRASASGVTETLDVRLLQRVAARLDGLPLALEMAAARLRTMTLAELAGSIDEGLGILTSPRRDVDQRHRTVRDLLEWSERLLGDRLRDSLFAMAVFAGPVRSVDLPAALDAPSAADTAAELVERSLVVAEPDPRGMTFRLFETVRSYGTERLHALGRDAAARRRHAAWFLDVLRDIEECMRDEREPHAIARFVEVYDEVRAAVRWSMVHDLDLAVDLVLTSYLPARTILRAEVVDWTSALVERVPTTDRAYWQLVAAQAGLLSTVGRLDDAVRLADDALPHVAGTAAAIRALEGMLDPAIYQGRLDDAVRVGERIAELATALGDDLNVDNGRIGAALATAYAGRIDEALAMLASGPRSNAPTVAGWFEYLRGECVLDLDPPTALRHLDRSLHLARSIGNRYLAEVAMSSSSSLRARIGDTDAAAREFIDLLEHFGIGGDPSHYVTSLRNLVTLLVRVGRFDAAAELHAAVVDHPSSPTYGAEAHRLAEAADQCRAALGDEMFDRAAAVGQARVLDDAVAAARGALREITPQPAVPAVPAAPAELVVEGDTWRVTFAGRTVRVRGVKGLRDIAVLIERCGAEVHAIELMGAHDVTTAARAQLDDRARRSYQDRIVDLQHDIDEANAHHDPARAERAEAELDALVQQLSASLGLGGRGRATGSSAERARSAVTNRIRAAIRKLDDVHPDLGRHLRHSVRTGTWCSYEPEARPAWFVEV